MVRVAIAQCDPHLADTTYNLALLDDAIEQAATQEAQLVVFPECAVTGYFFDSLPEALQIAEPIPGAITNRVARAADRHGIYVLFGMLERDMDRCFNTCVLVGPHGLEGVYRKTHTLCLGVDRFTTPGDLPYRVHDLPFASIGILICYDLRFPEAARSLALQNAQIIALPTNWPDTSTIQPEIFTRARAAENRVFILAADRVGEEAGAKFLGRSQVVNPQGEVVVEGPRDESSLLVCDINPQDADVKKVVLRAGAHEMDCFLDRRPELYGECVRGIHNPG